MKPPLKSVAVMGGGLTGLATAWWLRAIDADAQIHLIDSNPAWGGVLQTESVDGYLIEHSADMFSIEPSAALDLVQRLGRSEALVATLPVAQRAYVATDLSAQRMLPVPQGFSLMLPHDPQAVLDCGLLDEEGKTRFLAERRVPAKRDEQDESVADFAIRRFGSQVFERLIQPLVSGIYTADPYQLSMQATMSRFLTLEHQYGSLIQAASVNQPTSPSQGSRPSATEFRSTAAQQTPINDRMAFADQTASGARYDLFRAPRQGMGQLIDWIVDDLERVEFWQNSRVTRLQRSKSGWRLQVDQGGLKVENLEVDAVVLCGSPHSAAKLIDSQHATLTEDLKQIQASSCAVVVLGLQKQQLARPFEGYGIVVPAYLKRPLIAISCSSNKFPNRAAGSQMLFRCFLGGALQPELVDLPDQELLQITLSELRYHLPFVGEPELTRILRWRNAMPQYHVGHTQRVQRIQAAIGTLPGLELAGNSYNGVGIPVCINEGRNAAQRVVDFWRG